MRCRYCNNALAPSRSFVDGEFCCDDHRQMFELALPDAGTAEMYAAEEETEQEALAAEVEFSEISELADPEQTAEALEEDEPVFQESAQEVSGVRPNPAHETASWRWLSAAWKSAPRDLKLVSVLLPILLVVAVTGSLPKVPIQQLAPQNLDEVQSHVQRVVALQWKN